MPRLRTPLLVLAVLLVTPRPSMAQWVFLPDGRIGVNTSYFVSGFFSCSPGFAAVGYGCSAAGNHLSVTSGAATLDVTFAGASGDIVVRNVSDVFPLGTFNAVLGGTGPFLFPVSADNDAGALFEVAVGVSTNGYAPGMVNSVRARFWGNGSGVVRGDWDPSFVLTGFSPTQPSGYFYTAIAFSPVNTNGHGVTIDAGTGSTTIEARVGLIPEPSTSLLLATGLVGLIGVVRRQRRAEINSAD